MYLFPAIDMRGGKVVRLMHGDYDRQTDYHDDPIAQAELFADAGSTWLHVVDLDGARGGKQAHLEQIKQICALKRLKVEVGGGVRDQETVDTLLEAGVERVILGTAAFEKWDWFQGLVSQPAYDRKLVLGMDARKGKIALHGWEKQTDLTVMQLAREVSDWPLGAIIFTDIATDGTMQGPAVESTDELTKATNVPVVASGGVGNLDHLRALRFLDIEGVIVGRAIYENAFRVEEAIELLER